VIESIKKNIEILKKMVEGSYEANDAAIKERIKNLYIEIANGLKLLNQAQEDLRKIATEFKGKKSSKTEMDKFYSFVRAKTSAELDIATLIDKAWNLIVMEDHEEAVKVVKNILDIDPRHVRGLGLMGLVLMNREQYDEAMMYFQQVLLVDAENPFALNNLGYICYKKGIWGEAIEHLTKVSKQTKDRMAQLYAFFYLGLVYYERGMINDAVKFFEEAVKLGPNLQEAYYYLGLTELKRYEFKKSVEYFEKCINVDKTSKYGKLAENEVNKIKPIIDPQKILHKRNNT
jgi:tetratricopeptide (TPR) repeat protein